MLGYGRLIEERRKLAEISREDLGERMGRSASTIERFELEQGGIPNRDQVNVMVSCLPLTAEELLTAMGYVLNPPDIQKKVPTQLLEILAEMTPAEHQWLLEFLTSPIRGKGRVRK